MTIRCYDCTHPRYVHKDDCSVLGCACKAFTVKKPFGSGTITPTEKLL